MAGAYDTDGRSLRESLEEEREGEYQVPLLKLMGGSDCKNLVIIRIITPDQGNNSNFC